MCKKLCQYRGYIEKHRHTPNMVCFPLMLNKDPRKPIAQWHKLIIVQNTSKTYHHSMFYPEGIFRWSATWRFPLDDTDCIVVSFWSILHDYLHDYKFYSVYMSLSNGSSWIRSPLSMYVTAWALFSIFTKEINFSIFPNLYIPIPMLWVIKIKTYPGRCFFKWQN